jgi:hypothetical protein
MHVHLIRGIQTTTQGFQAQRQLGVYLDQLC